MNVYVHMHVHMFTSIRAKKKKSSGRKYIEIVDSDCQVLTQ